MMRMASRMAYTTLLLLGWRNLWRHRRRTIITLSSIALGFGLAVFAIGLGDSGHNSMIRNAIAMGDGHITIQPRDYFSSPANYRFLSNGRAITQVLDGLQIAGRVAPRVSLQVLVSTANNSIGAGLEGIEVAQDPRRDMLLDKVVEGEWPVAGDRRGLIIGAGMARKLKARIGSKIVIMSGKRGGDSVAHLARVRAIFKSGIDELDSYLALADLQLAQEFLLAEGGVAEQLPVTRIAVFLDDSDTLEQWYDRIKPALHQPDTVVMDWREMMPELVQYIVIDDAGNYVFLLLILIVVVFGIVNTVLMSVLERTREFGLLRALGLNRSYLLLMVLAETFFLSLLAVAAGWVIGGSIHLYMAHYGIDISALVPEGTTFGGTFMDPIIHSELSAARIYQLTVIVFLTTLATGIYPAIKAIRVAPVEALRT